MGGTTICARRRCVSSCAQSRRAREAGGRRFGSVLEDARERRGGRTRGARDTERSDVGSILGAREGTALISDSVGVSAADDSAARARGQTMHEDDTDTVGNTVGSGQNVGWASLESSEALAAMDDEAFARFTTRALASHRKIFMNQQRFWAWARARANLHVAHAGADRLRERLATAKSGGEIPSRTRPGDEPESPRVDDGSGEGSREGSRDGSVAVRRFRAGPGRGAVEDRQKTRIVTLPKANNVPRYTNYIYSAFENSYVEDEVRRRLLFPDHEGEMLEAGDSEDDSDSDSDSRSGSGSGSSGLRAEKPGDAKSRSVPRRPTVAKPPSDADRKAKKKEEERRRKEEEDAEHAAAGPWDRKDDYILFAAASILGTSDRAIARVAENLKLTPAVVRARLKMLLREPDSGGGGARRVSHVAWAHREAKAKQEAGITSADLYRRAMSEARRARDVIGARDASKPERDAAGVAAGVDGDGAGAGDDSKVDSKPGLGAGFSPAPKEEPADDALDDDEGMEDAAALANPRGAERAQRQSTVRELKAENARQMGLWNLTAWLFLCDDNVVVEDDGLAYEHVDPALDSFRTLYCARCHMYDCILHGCGQEQPAVKLGKDPKEARAGGAWAAAAAGAEDQGGTSGRGSPAIASVEPPCGPECWRLTAVLDDDTITDTPTFNAEAIKAAAARRAEAEGAAAAEERARKRKRRAAAGKKIDDDKADDEKDDDDEVGTDAEVAGFLNDAPVDATGAGVAADDAEVGTLRRGDSDAGAGTVVAAWGEWSSFDESYYRKLRAMYDRAPGGAEPCAIARAMDGPSCEKVYLRVRADLEAEAKAEVMRTGAEAAEESDGRRGAGRGGGRGRGRGRGRKTTKFTSQRKRTTATIRRRMANSEDLVWVQYTPCSCGDDRPCNPKTCGCMSDGNFCEKYCGCRGRCVNKFGGCTCKNGTCRTRACPCFAAARECDPDVCKRCTATAEQHAYARRDGWPFTDICMPVPPPPAPPTETARQKNTAEKCMNMRLLLREHKHICLGLSAVSGWGAFLKDGAKKNELLGEYTGELITQAEADRRGKIYDRVNLSFLFNLNDQWVLDAHLKGNKLKFANHSGNPNCYAKVLMVRGDHRVGIFAKDNIAPGEELTYDYRYERDKAPAWVDGSDAPDTVAPATNGS